MADLLGLITGGLTAATNIGNARDEGMAARRKEARDDLLARIERERQDADAAVRRDYMIAQTRSMTAPKAPRTQVVDGMLVDLDTGVARPIQGMPQVGGRGGAQGGPARARAYEERSESGGVAIYEDGRFRSWKIRPTAEQSPAPAGQPATESPNVTAAELGRVQAQSRAVRDMGSALDNFEQAIANGVTIMPGEQRANTETTYRLVQMQLKTLLELGVLAGPDMDIIEGIITPPSSVSLQAQRVAGVKPEDVLRAQVQRLRQYLQNKAQNFMPPSGSPGANTPTGSQVQTSTGRTFTRPE